MNDILMGVIIGFASSAIIYLLKNIIGKLVSYFISFFTRSISGDWDTSFKKENTPHSELAHIYQVGPWVWGTIHYIEKNRKYNFRGIFKQEVLSATYEITGSNSVVDRGSFTLALQRFGDSTKMNGCYSWTDDDSDTPLSDTYIWTKK